MRIKQLDEYRQEIINDGSAVITVYDYRGTDKERPFILKPGEKVIIHIKEKPQEIKKRSKKFEKSEESKDTKITDIGLTE